MTVAGGVLGAALLILPVPAAVASSGGALAPPGGDAPGTPSLTEIACLTRCAFGSRVRAGATIELKGRNLAAVTRIVFRGRPGRADDVAVAVRAPGEPTVRLRVPPTAPSGPLSAQVGRRLRSSRLRIAILSTPPSVEAQPGPQGAHVFPVRGPHAFGGAGGRFGAARGGRSHHGQDISAPCGAPVLAARGGVVEARRYHALAGHYLVIDSDATGFDYVYVHLASAPLLERGATVSTGERIGEVGATGNARGCHLHLELWGEPGWHSGGVPIDPLRSLRSWYQPG